MKIENSVVLITGASGGIGLATAELLAARGAKLALVARSQDKLEALAARLPGALALPADLSRAGEARRVVEAAAGHFGRLDVLINNAGQGMHAPIESIPAADYRAVMDLNVFAVLEAMQAAIPIMRRQGGGMILNISSLVSKNYFPGLAAYASTKYALNALTLTARAELQGEGIVVGVFYPKMTATDFGANARGQKYDSRAGRPGMVVDPPEAVAEAIAAQIASEAAEAAM